MGDLFGPIIQWLKDVWNDGKIIIFISDFEKGVLMRGGKFCKILESGWHWRIPFLDEYYAENVENDAMDFGVVNITTLDGKTASIGGMMLFNITDITKNILKTNTWKENAKIIGKASMSDHLEEIGWDEIKKKGTKTAIKNLLKPRMDEMGITVKDFLFTDKGLTKIITLMSDKDIHTN